MCIGLAIEHPRTVIEASFAENMSQDPEIIEVLRRLENVFDIDLSNISVRILSRAPKHVGLGSTTQLKLSIARAVLSLLNIDVQNMEYLSQILGRGEISGVGTYAHAYGGLVIDMGKRKVEEFPKLYMRLEFPRIWYIVVARGEGRGPDERREHSLFAYSCPIELVYEASFQVFSIIVPAIVERDFELFCRGLERLQLIVGKMFEKAQGGIFSGSSEELVSLLKKLGLKGVGQSSWGPTVYGFTLSRDHASKCVEELRKCGFWAHMVRADNSGARVIYL